MPTGANITLLTERDIEVLAALAMTPLTAEQLRKISRTFAAPFPDARRVRERLRALCDVQRAQAFRYATAGPGAPAYYVLTPLGFRLLHGPDAALPARRQFAPIGIARQRHTFALAETIVHTAVAVHIAGGNLTNFSRENSLRLDIGQESLAPDSAFQLIAPSGNAFNFTVELDNASERVHSDKDADSWQRKVRLYEAYADTAPRRFRVLLITTGGPKRLMHMLEAAGRAAKNPQRSLVYGITLDRYLAESAAVTSPCWLDHRGRPVCLLANRTDSSTKQDVKTTPILLR